MDETAVWTTKDIVATIVATGVISALVTSLLTWAADAFISSRKSRLERSYLTTRIAVALETYASRCSFLVARINGGYQMYRDVPNQGLPQPPEYPTEADWRTIDPELSYKVLTFLTEIEREKSDADYARHFENNPFHVESAAKTSGQGALELASELRKSIGLTPDPEHEKALRTLFQ